MKRLVNATLAIELPEGFVEMDPAELTKNSGSDYPNILGFKDEERHVIIAFMWKESSKLLLKTMSTKSLAERAEKGASRGNKPFGYHCDGFFETQIAGEEAHGFRYGYTVEGVAQYAETMVIKHEACSYTLYYYTRVNCAEANQALHDELFASLAFE